jgi:signal transduction histidine kinase
MMRIASKVHTMPSPTATLSTPFQAALPGLPPSQVLRAYLLGVLPLFLAYMLTVETDGDFSKGFNVLSALWGTLRNCGPALLLLLPVWSYIGWMERRGFGITRLLLNHGAMAIVFAAGTQLLVYLLIWASEGLAAAQSSRQRWFLWQGLFSMMMYCSAAGGFTAYRAVWRARTEAAATVQAQTLLARTELVALRNKLNPHFLFNTLHSIIALTRKDAASAEKALLMFSDMLRYVLDTEKAGHDDVPLQEELDFTRDYLALEALRLGKRLNVQWDIDESAMHHAVPALSIQPLVENSIKHAFNPRTVPGQLTISAKLDNAGRALTVAVADDGPGCGPDVLDAASGLGLKTVTRRLQLQHGADAGLRISTQPSQGFKVEFTLPLH